MSDYRRQTNKSSDKSNQIRMATLSNRDKISRKLTANTSMTDSAAAVQTIRMLIFEFSAMEMTQVEGWKFPRLFPWSPEMWDNYCFSQAEGHITSNIAAW